MQWHVQEKPARHSRKIAGRSERQLITNALAIELARGVLKRLPRRSFVGITYDGRNRWIAARTSDLKELRQAVDASDRSQAVDFRALERRRV